MARPGKEREGGYCNLTIKGTQLPSNPLTSRRMHLLTQHRVASVRDRNQASSEEHMDSTEPSPTSSVLAEIISAMDALEAAERDRVLTTLATYYGRGHASPADSSIGSQTLSNSVPPFAQEERDPKAFFKEKAPTTDVERIACLAFYLANYRDQPFFKTQDLTKLNTEAAQPRFSNASFAAANAVKAGYLAAGTKGQRQISAFGEEFVTALPDREAAKEVASRLRPKRRPKKRAPNTLKKNAQDPKQAARSSDK